MSASATSSLVAELAGRNKTVAASHQPISTFAELAEAGKDVPRVVVITCVDSRCVPEYFLDLKQGDGVLVMRNICGHIEPALNDILALDSFLSLKEIMIIHHTDCGAFHFTDSLIKDVLKKRLPGHAGSIDDMAFGAFGDLEQSVRDDIAVLKASPLVREELVAATSGFVYDLKTGGLTPVSL
ncbi:Uncharacterized protein LAWI1_G002966 [Lachnellula willkommii]|uniref:Carbonic anhydrase n=1 Tax=Lachnellula willkommii TaxID=215461 RepID=A0A559MBV4_9HELO|nr:Uncharacterized protein LAWI1_G002966 [Lachnellula willkommii]